ncbi:hypothetical protein [Hwangdonia lutea]|uniref:Uncharacterized protein n=1 Tax=Hwangdonia lutea TaxID=3075823 RepID=A0AA97EKV4_9FLAO|nr:hypothetical protein [Hwangdonia sp. SCSIO 19198]WOD42876.1 hypothetical protein RNZ46_12840 [Hwangdonia sp. SCSIO 19198]
MTKLSVFNRSRALKLGFKLIKLSFSFSLIIFIFNCENQDRSSAFKSNLANKSVAGLIGSEYAVNSRHEWNIANNRIECLVSTEDRKMYLRTHQLSDQKGDLEMRVNLGFYNNKITSSNINWAGFNIGFQGPFKQNLDKPNDNNGINLGVCTNGTLFIGDPGPNQKNDLVIDQLSQGISLVLTIQPDGETYTLLAAIYNRETGALLSKVSKKQVMPNELSGRLALVSNFENLGNPKLYKEKSVWFKDWNVRGSKVIKSPNNLEQQNEIKRN